MSSGLVIMDPDQSDSFVDPSLAGAFAMAKDGIPFAHRIAPLQDEIVESREAGYTRLQDWAFCNGYALAIESSKPSFKGGPISRIVVQCVHHKETTRNSRKIGEAERRRVSKKTQANGCRFSMYISQRKRLGGLWAIGYTQPEHNHDPLSDPFQYDVHRSRKPGHLIALDIAATHLGTITYGKSKEILQKQGLHVDRKTFYNLKRREQEGQTGISRYKGTETQGLLPETSIEKRPDGSDCLLQLREWDAVEAIKRRLIAAGKYSTERRIELVRLVWAWVKADTIQKMVERREKLLSELHEEERAYLVEEYQPKERQLIRVYTIQTPKPRVQSPQQIEAAKERKRRYRQRMKDLEDGGKRDAATGRAEPLVNPHEYVFGSRNVADAPPFHDEATFSDVPSQKRICTGLARSTEFADFIESAENTGVTRSIGFSESAESEDYPGAYYPMSTKSIQSAQSEPTDYTSSVECIQSTQSAESADYTGPYYALSNKGIQCVQSAEPTDYSGPKECISSAQVDGPTDSAISAECNGPTDHTELTEDINAARSIGFRKSPQCANYTGSTDHTMTTERIQSAPRAGIMSLDGEIFPEISGFAMSTISARSKDYSMSEESFGSAHTADPAICPDFIQLMNPSGFAERARSIESVMSARPAESNLPTEITRPAESTGPAEIAGPAESSLSVAITMPGETTGPAEIAGPAESNMPVEITRPTESTAPAEIARPAESAVRAESTVPAQTTSFVDCAEYMGCYMNFTEHVESTGSAESTSPAETLSPTESTSPAESTPSAESALPLDGAVPTASTISLDFTESAPNSEPSASTRSSGMATYITSTVSGMVRNALAAVSTRKRGRPWDF